MARPDRGAIQRAKRHHTVTRAYLELFADETGLVAVFDKQTGNEFQTDPVNAAVVGDFNTVNVPGVPADTVEAGLAAGEGDAVAAIARLQAGSFPNDVERVAIARFVALHFARTLVIRRFSDELASSMEDWLGEMTSSLAANGAIPADAVAVPDFSLDQNDHVATMLELIEHAWRSLYERSWTIVELPHMVTSDFPVFLNADPETARFGVGIGTAHEIAFALGPEHALVLSMPYGGPNRRVRLEAESEVFLRQRIWRSADRFTYRRPGTPMPDAIDPRERAVWGLRPKPWAPTA